jgi:hypothetical protein
MVDSFAVAKINTINKLLKVFTCIGFTKSPMTNLKLVVFTAMLGSRFTSTYT